MLSRRTGANLSGVGQRPGTVATKGATGGNIGITYYDFRNDDPATAALETDLWFTRSTDGGLTWGEERVTPTSFDMRSAPDANGYFVGDYEGLSALGTTFYPFWSESHASGTDVFASTSAGAVRTCDLYAFNGRGRPACLGVPGDQGQANSAVSRLPNTRRSHRVRVRVYLR
jgi:hypothetical protein